MSANTTANSYLWEGPNGFSSTGQNPQVSGAQIYNGGVYYLRVTNGFGCTSSQGSTNNVTVNPTPAVNNIPNQQFCVGQQSAPVNFSGTPGGVNFSWTSSPGGIGNFPANGSGSSFPAFTPTTTGTATVTVTPSTNNGVSCTGQPKTFTISVSNPPTVSPVASQTVCHGQTVNVNFTGTSGAGFTWSNDNTSIGLGSGSTGNISFTATNTTAAPVTANITVTPTFGASCNGMPTTFTITVNPQVTMNAAPTTQTVCNGASTAAINFTAAANTTFSWANDMPSIGLAASGSGNIPAFTAVNTGTAPVTATLIVTPSKITGGVTCTGSPQTVTITVNPTPTVTYPANQSFCVGYTASPVAFAGPVIGTSFTWTSSSQTIGIAAGSTGDIPAFTALAVGSATVTVTASATMGGVTCTGPPQTFTITIGPLPTVMPVTNKTVCHGALTTVNFSGSAGASFNWANNNTAIGLGTSGTGNISFTATNTTTDPITSTVTVTPSLGASCNGNPTTFTITVNPQVNMTAAPLTQTVCNGATTTPINFSSATGTTFAWIINTNIGLPLSGSGNIPAFTAVNTGTAPVTATITVTPSNTTSNVTCSGIPQTLTITVNPTPTVAIPANQSICNGATTAAVNFSGGVSGTTFSWTNNQPGIGLAASGSGNIPAFTAVNSGTTPVVATITVTPSANNCTGASQTFTITVNPTPTVADPADQIVCNGTATAPVNFTGAVAGTTFTWTNNLPSIGLPANGSGNIASFTASNSGTTTVVATITVTPSANGCTGASQTFTITIKPSPTVADPPDQAVCHGASTAPINFSGNLPGTTFSWAYTPPNIGLPLSGTGNISAFLVNNPGTVPIVATFTVTTAFNGCTGASQTFTIAANPLPAVFALSGPAIYCASDPGAPLLLSGSQVGVSYQVLQNGTNAGTPTLGTGGPLSLGFFPAGTYTVRATYVAGGCSQLMSGSLTVAVFNCTIEITDPCVCKNNATTLADGQFSESIKVNAPGFQVWTIKQVSGLFQALSPPTPLPPNPFAPNTALTNIGSNMFTLDGLHVDAIGYSITVTNGTTDLTIGNSCQYPNPVISSDLTGPFCLFSNPVPLVGTPGDANVVSAGFTVDGQPATEFNPATAGTGPHTIIYAVNGGTPKAFGPNDPGCSIALTQIVNVVATPTNLTCNNHIQVSLEADCTTEITPDMVLEGTYGCFDDYTVQLRLIPSNVLVGNTVNASHIGKKLKATVTHLVSGNTCWGEISVEDKLPPTLTCDDVVVNCAVTNLDPRFLRTADNPATQTIEGLGIAEAFPNLLNWPDANISFLGNDQYRVLPAAGLDCQPLTLSFSDIWVDVPCGGTFGGRDVSAYIRRIWSAVDASGNIAQCTQTIYLERRHVSDVVFPIDVTVDCANPTTDPAVTGVPYLLFNSIRLPLYPGTTSCELNLTFADQIVPVCDGTYKILRTWTVYDWCLPTQPFPPYQNPIYYIQVIKVVDETGPTVLTPSFCGQLLTVSTGPLDCLADVNLPDPIVTDDCSRLASVKAEWRIDGVTKTLFGNYATFPGNNFWDRDTLAVLGVAQDLPVGLHRVTYTFADDCGNHTTCDINIRVQDQTPPQVNCTEFTQVALGASGMTLVNASSYDQGSADNCGEVYFKARRMNSNDCQVNNRFHDQVKFCCEDVGDTIQVILRVYDVTVQPGEVGLTYQEDNSNDCMVRVFVEDKLKPVCTAPANVTVSCEAFDPSLWAYGFADATDNCCLDTTTETRNYSLFDTLCNRGTITRTFRAVDCYGQTGQCTQRVFVNYNQDYHIRFPNDRVVFDCDGTTAFGEPVINKKDCELIAISYVDQVFTVVPDACYKIERLWTITNWCTYDPNQPCIYVDNPNPNSLPNASANLQGPTVSPNGTPAPWNPSQVALVPGGPIKNFADYWQANANCYQYKQIIKVIDNEDPVIDSYELTDCDLTANDPQFWNTMDWWDPIHGQHDLCEAPVQISMTALDSCSGSNVDIRALVFLDLNGDGIMETVLNTNDFPTTPFGTIRYGNAQNPNYTGGQVREFDHRPVLSQLKYRFALRDQIIGGKRKVTIAWTDRTNPNPNNNGDWVDPQVPLGKHKIKWFVEDNCGNETVWESPWDLHDCKAPTVVCFNGLSVNIMPTQMITIWASDFLQYGEDNCTPAGQLVYSIRKSGTGTGFPLDANGNPIPGVTFTCAELGTQYVELWARDARGNASYCETYVIVQDPSGSCGQQPKASVAGDLQTEKMDGLEDATVEIHGSHPALPPVEMFDLTNDAGHFEFPTAIPLGSNYMVVPVKDDNPLNGVSTYDLLEISKHILGAKSLGSPYRMIAADVNKSGSITSFDILELRKLILGIYNDLPDNTSWRFVDRAYVFPNPQNPFSAPIPEIRSLADLQSNQMDDDFVAVKIGDVNESAIPNAKAVADDRTSGTWLMDVAERDVRAGEMFTAQFRADESALGAQFTLIFNNLEIVEVLPGVGLKAENFAVFAAENVLTASFEAVEGGRTTDDGAVFSLKLRAKADGKLSRMLSVSSRITRAEAYSPAGEKQAVALRFKQEDGQSEISAVGLELYQNQPNPFVSRTVIGFHLPETAEATLTVFDETGRMVFRQNGEFAKGHNAVSIDRKQLGGATGLLWYQLDTAAGTATRKMVLTQ